MKRITEKQRKTRDMHIGIKSLYASGKYTTVQVAEIYNVSTKQVQRIAKKYGVLRTLAESNKLIAPLKNYHKTPFELRARRKQISQKLRYEMIQAHPYCANCGQPPGLGIRLEIDHIDENAENNIPKNLQVLCENCNVGKSHLARFGVSHATS